MRVVAALGGNALLRRNEIISQSTMQENIRSAVNALVPIARSHQLIVTHGNGPQIGIIAMQNEAGPEEGRSPLDVLGAQSQGMIGYIIEREMRNALGKRRSVATLLTQVLVDPDDPAFLLPSKPIGLHYEESHAQELGGKRRWTMVRDGTKWRRAVASPQPVAILDIEVIEALVSNGFITICLGGVGVPVARDRDGMLHGVEAVVDKDLASSMLAQKLHADALLLLTDVDAVYESWGKEPSRRLTRVLASSLDPQQFEAGTMRPKISAAKSFVLSGGICAIGRLEDASDLLAGKTGTLVSTSRYE
jgi:carbamate kinase